MTFPGHIAEVFERFRVPAETQAALYDLYVSMGADALDAFAEWTSATGNSPAATRPEDVTAIRALAVDRYLMRNHPRWINDEPTATLFNPREAEGRFAGVAAPVGAFDPETEGNAGDAARAASSALEAGQSVPSGILMLSRNGHFGGRPKTISFDVVERDLESALRFARAEGRQHTLPGSAGETTGSLDGSSALIWEIQPNVLKPEGDRNRDIRAIYGRHRNWHVATLAAALLWIREKVTDLWVVRGAALKTVHEVNPGQPVSELVTDHHDRTVKRVSEALGMFLVDPGAHDAGILLDTELMNAALTKAVSADGATPYLWRVRW